MSYLVLARKWRPKSFDTLVGQEHVVRALRHALEQNRLHHAYLFTGTRGVGKTTIARIFAKALNCAEGVTATPCGQCSPCREIDSGRFIDYLEMDAASNRGVEDMASLLEKAAYAPNSGRYKVYMIDEVHQLSGHAFNAMLKTLEEPPEHVKFVLATTDPQKIPVTVLSRCLQFNLKQMSVASIVDHLSQVLTAEGVAFEAGALRCIAKAAAGSMRDALSLLDQAIAHGGGGVAEEGVQAMLGSVGDDHLFAIIDALAAGDIDAMLATAAAMEARSIGFDSALQELAALLHRIALVQFAPTAILDDGERSRLAVLAQQFDAEFLQLCYQIAIQGRSDLPLAPDEAAGFSMTLLRLFAFRPGAAATPPGSAAAPPGARRTAAPAPGVRAAPPTPAPGPDAASPPHKEALPAPLAASDQATDSSSAQDSADGGARWRLLVEKLALTGMARQLAQHCELAAITDDAVQLRLQPAHKHLAARAQQEKLQQALTECIGRKLTLNLELSQSVTETPVQHHRHKKRALQERAIASIEGDPFVREACDLFDASIDEATIKPV